jgi:hypothetical protein
VKRLRWSAVEKLRRAVEKMTNDHPRNTGPMRSSRCCGATTRSGQALPVSGRRLEKAVNGGAPGSGGPRPDKNALKHAGIAEP